MTKIQELKMPLRAFYSNESTEMLCRILALCQDGKIYYQDCCCFIGVTTGQFCNRTQFLINNHYFVAKQKPFAAEAEQAIIYIGYKLSLHIWAPRDQDVSRRRIVAAIVKGILRLRERSSREPGQNGAAVDRVTQKILQEVQV